jgi:hypothetical protein
MSPITAVLTPRYLTREGAALYLGVSVDVFDDEVRAGVWPPARRRGGNGGRHTWDRLLLDQYADRHSGLESQTSPAKPIATPADFGKKIIDYDSILRKRLEKKAK